MAIDMNGATFDQWANSGSKLSYGAWAAGQNSPAPSPAPAPTPSPSNNWVSQITPTGTPTPTPTPAPTPAPVKEVAPFSNEKPVTQAELEKQAYVAEQNKTNQSIANNNVNTATVEPVKPVVQAATVPIVKTPTQIQAEMQANAVAGISGKSFTAPQGEYTLKAYDTNNNIIYVKPGEYVKGASIEKKNIPLDNLIGDNITNIDGSSISDDTQTGVVPINKTPQKSVFEDMAITLSQNRPIEFQALENRRNTALAEIEANNKVINEKLKLADETYSRAKQIELDSKNAYDKAKIEGEFARQKELLDGMQLLMTTTYQTTPDGTIPVSILSRQNAGKFAGMNSMLKASQGYVTSAVDNITKYFSEARLENANTADQIWQYVDLFENRNIELNKNEQADFMKQIDVLQKQDEENVDKETAIKDFIKNNSIAYSISDISPDDNYETIVDKIGKSTQQVNTFNYLMDKYPDVDINYAMSVNDMISAVQDSKLYNADLLSKDKTQLSVSEKLSLEKQLRQNFEEAGMYPSPEVIAKLVTSTEPIRYNYGDTTKDLLRSKVQQVAGQIPSTRVDQFLSSVSEQLENDNLAGAIKVINDNAILVASPADQTTVSANNTLIRNYNNALNYMQDNGIIDVKTGKLTSVVIDTFSKIGTSKPAWYQQVSTMLGLGNAEEFKRLYGAVLSEGEMKKAEDIFASPSANTFANLLDVIKLHIPESQAKIDYVYNQYGGIITDDLSRDYVSGAYANNININGIGAKDIINKYISDNPGATFPEISTYLYGLSENGDSIGNSSSYKGEAPNYKDSDTFKKYASTKDRTIAMSTGTSSLNGQNGGQCGYFLRENFNDFPTVGNYQYTKKNAVDKYGIAKSDWTPEIGDTFVETIGKNGHVAKVAQVLPGNKIRVLESNYNNNGKITTTRIIDLNEDNNVYGAFKPSNKHNNIG